MTFAQIVSMQSVKDFMVSPGSIQCFEDSVGSATCQRICDLGCLLLHGTFHITVTPIIFKGMSVHIGIKIHSLTLSFMPGIPFSPESLL